MHTKIRAKIRNLGQSEDIVIEIPPESVDNRVGTGKTATVTETSLTSLILPVQAFYRRVLLIPSSPVFRFNPETKRYEHGPAQKSGMISGAALTLVAALYHCVMSRFEQAQATNRTNRVFLAVFGVSRLIAIVAFYLEMYFSGPIVAEVLNGIQELATELTRRGAKFPGVKRLRRISTTLWVSFSALGALFAITSMDGHGGSTVFLGSEAFMQATVQRHINATQLILRLESRTLGELNALVGGFATGLIFLATWWAFLLWAMCYLTTFFWGLTFWLLFRAFLNTMNKETTIAEPLLHEIRQFGKIAALVAKYNEAFGTVTLASVLGGGIYFSVNIYQAFETAEDGYLQRAVALGTFFWFCSFLGAGALVHSTAGKVVQVVNGRFQSEHSWNLHEGNQSMETTQGLMLILHSLQTNEVGLQGRKFFTLTFPFCGTVLSAISTYAVIVIQFQT